MQHRKPIQETIVIIKPDIVLNGLVQRVKDFYLENNLRIILERSIHLTSEQAASLYYDHRGSYYYTGLIMAMSYSNCHALVLEGPNAIHMVRLLNGNHDPEAAGPGKLRFEVRGAGGPFNTVYATDCVEEVERVSKIIFGPQIGIKKQYT